MALDTASLKTAIKAAFKSVEDYTGETPADSKDAALEKIATDLAAAITIFVKSGTVTTTVAPAIPVQVTCPAGTGATTGPGTGTGSVA